jgi:large subunit ribosomal protein L23
MKFPYSVLRQHQLTEKGTRLREAENKYLFKVSPSANKMQIKEAVEKLFKVDVVRVNTMNYAGKRRRERIARYGWKPDWKRAIVTLKSGQKIEME